MSEMKNTMEEEYKEMIRTLERANSALARVFNVEEGEGMSTCMGCLKDFNDEDLTWQGGLLCEGCKVE